MDDDANKDEAIPHGASLPGDDDGTTAPPATAPGLGDMPCEILGRIVAFVDHPRHLLLLRRTSPLFDQANPVAAAIVWGAQRMHLLLPAGAPLDVVTSALAVRNRPLYAEAVVHAVKGRRLAVVRAVFEAIARATPCDREDTDDGVPPPNPLPVSAHDRDEAKMEAMTVAVSRGLLDIARYIYKTTWYVRENMTSSALAEHAAASERLDALVFVHDIYARKHAHGCRCDANVGSAAWSASNPELVRWMRDTGCDGAIGFDATHVARALRFGHDDMLRYMAADGWGDIQDDPNVSGAVADAAGSGLWETVVVAIDLGLCASLTPILVGAANDDRVDVLERALGGDSACVARLPPVDRAGVRAAVFAAATSDSAGALRWLLDRFGPDLADAPLMWAALMNSAMDAVCLVEPLLRDPFPWADALLFAALGGAHRVVRYIVEQKRVPVTPIVVAAAGGRSEDNLLLDFLCETCTLDQLQAGVDTLAATESEGQYGSTVRGIKRRVPELCTANVVAMQTDMALTAGLSGYHKWVEACACARCAPAPPLQYHADSADETRTPAPKRRRAEADLVDGVPQMP
ncbi:hypothetical protein pdul_cds_892 [Pandoravirus dulcis]|uniref:F-box incomplete domain containing protein n=1 Tax=Pandoravirus dulcis TaxID=1349409 RepID=S4VYH8_9VIRU|nr:hypothetical protein pdul_cds_892 [Pandoravirus dulcis]AGO83121.2 hypothetical protein pdul_cds_892 [Pandoravirus dulcis]